MTDQEMNLKIAEALGWDLDPQETWEWKTRGQYCKRGSDPVVPRTYLPSYTTDLNAMHEAEKTLDREELIDYCNFTLRRVTGEGCAEDYKMITATARQRAEAFLRVKGLWKEATV